MKKYRIRKAIVRTLSLCPKGANQLPTVYKEDDPANCPFEIQTIVKADMEKGELTAIVYAAEFRDSQGDIASAEVIKEALYKSSRNGLEIDLRHDNIALSKDQAYIAENFIIHKNDPRFSDLKDYSGNSVDAEGAWAVVIKVDDPELREKYKSGEWQGISLGGVADMVVEKEDNESVANKVLELLQKKMNTNGDLDMTPDEIKALLKENNEAQKAELVKAFPDMLTEVLKGMGIEPKKKEEPGSEDELKFEGEPTAENLAKHAAKIRKAQILGDIDWADPKSVDEGQAAIAKMEKEEAEAKEKISKEELEAAGVGDEDPEEVRDLKLKLFKAERRSNQEISKDTPAPTGEAAEIALGDKIAKEMNTNRGM